MPDSNFPRFHKLQPRMHQHDSKAGLETHEHAFADFHRGSWVQPANLRCSGRGGIEWSQGVWIGRRWAGGATWYQRNDPLADWASHDFGAAPECVGGGAPGNQPSADVCEQLYDRGVPRPKRALGGRKLLPLRQNPECVQNQKYQKLMRGSF